MSGPRFLTDEHVPGSCISVLRSLGYEVSRAKDEFPEGTTDATLLEFAAETDLVVLTCDKRFTIIDGDHVSDHAGVIHADQEHLQRDPEDAVAGIDRIVSTMPDDERRGAEFYLTDWL